MWYPALQRSCAVVAAVNAAGFGVTAATGSHKITDLCGTAGFIASAAVALRFAPAPLAMRSRLLGAAAIAWGVRLGGYLGYRVVQTGDDERLRPFFRAPGEAPLDWTRSAFPLKLAGFWTAQSVWAIAVSLPITLAIAMPASAAAAPLGAFGIAGVTLFAAGFALETVADAQKFVFKRDPTNARAHCAVGVWQWSRHPNYAGEIALWSGLTLLAAPALAPAPLALALSLVSPALTAALLLGISGVPLLEAQHDAKYGGDAAYVEWKRRTPCVFPNPVRLFR